VRPWSVSALPRGAARHAGPGGLGQRPVVVRPLLTLSKAAARFSAGDLSVRTGLPHTSDESDGWRGPWMKPLPASRAGSAMLAQANRALRVLSAGNRTMLHGHDEPGLLQDMCRAIVEAGDYRMAGWVMPKTTSGVRRGGILGRRAGVSRPSRHHLGRSAVGPRAYCAAIRHGIPSPAAMHRWTPTTGLDGKAQRFGYASSLSLPLREDGTVIARSTSMRGAGCLRRGCGRAAQRSGGRPRLWHRHAAGEAAHERTQTH